MGTYFSRPMAAAAISFAVAALAAAFVHWLGLIRRKRDPGGMHGTGWAALASAALLAGCAQAPPAADPAFQSVVALGSPDRALLASAIIEETNRARAANRAPPLVRFAQLDSAADEQALHMALTQHLEHSNPLPSEGTAAARVARAGFQAAHVSENAIVWPAAPPAGSGQPPFTYSQLAAALVGSWMNSPAHRINLLDPGSTCIGCAARFARNALGQTMVFSIQEFALPATGGIGGR
jgi:uncharacterized protein YkwD